MISFVSSFIFFLSLSKGSRMAETADHPRFNKRLFILHDNGEYIFVSQFHSAESLGCYTGTESERDLRRTAWRTSHRNRAHSNESYKNGMDKKKMNE
jgi:hypothetical protein